MESIGVLLFEPCFDSAGFDPPLRLGLFIKLLKCTEAGGIARVIIIVVYEVRYLVKPLVLATGQLLVSCLQGLLIAGHRCQIVQRQSYHSTAMPG